MDAINLYAALFYAMMGGGYSPVNPPNGFSDGFQNNYNIDMPRSKNFLFDSQRSLVHPERKLGRTVLHEPFDSLGAWKVSSSGSGKVSIELTNETDAAVGKYTLKLDTGAIVGSKAGVRKSNMAVPNTFGVLIIPDVEGLVDGKDDPLELNIKKLRKQAA